MAIRRHLLWRAAAPAAALLGATVLSPADAAVNVVRTATHTATVITWGATPTTTSSGTPSPGTVSLTFTSVLFVTTPPQYLYVANTGTATLTGTSYTVTGITGLLGAPTLTLKACVGASWNTSNDTCAGSTTTIGTFTAVAQGPVASATTAASAGSRLHLQASTSSFSVGSYTAVFTTSVSASGPRQIAAATTTNS